MRPREWVSIKAKWSRVYVCQRVALPEAQLPVWRAAQAARAGQRERTGLRAAPDSLLSGSLLTVRCHDAEPGKQGKGNRSAGPRPTLKHEEPYLVTPERHTRWLKTVFRVNTKCHLRVLTRVSFGVYPKLGCHERRLGPRETRAVTAGVRR